MPENKEMVGKAIGKLKEGKREKEVVVTISAYDDKKPYRLHIGEIKRVGPKIREVK